MTSELYVITIINYKLPANVGNEVLLAYQLCKDEVYIHFRDHLSPPVGADVEKAVETYYIYPHRILSGFPSRDHWDSQEDILWGKVQFTAMRIITSTSSTRDEDCL
jgi:hypothetical protein